jgi:hypothetical protein
MTPLKLPVITLQNNNFRHVALEEDWLRFYTHILRITFTIYQ